jgi:hypothetical protein
MATSENSKTQPTNPDLNASQPDGQDVHLPPDRNPSPGREEEAAERAAHGQSRAMGDTGDRDTGVKPETQGISNRQGDAPDND